MLGIQCLHSFFFLFGSILYWSLLWWSSSSLRRHDMAKVQMHDTRFLLHSKIARWNPLNLQCDRRAHKHRQSVDSMAKWSEIHTASAHGMQKEHLLIWPLVGIRIRCTKEIVKTNNRVKRICVIWTLFLYIYFLRSFSLDQTCTIHDHCEHINR